MKSIVTWFVKNSVPANLFMFFLIVGGVASYQNMKSEFFPAPDINIITIQVPYLGASATEIESSICAKIEDRIEGISGIKKISSYALENAGIVSATLYNPSEIDDILDQIKTVVNNIDTFPVDSEKPVIQKVEFDNPPHDPDANRR